MEHLHSRVPYAQWRLRIFRQLFLPSGSSNPGFLSRRVHSSNGRVQDDHNATTRDHSKTRGDDTDSAGAMTPPSQLLPQSPLITHPNPGRAIRHRKKRLPTRDDLSDSDLSNNPWAVALASPVRMCSATGMRMPKAFLTEWGLVEQPASAASSNLDPKSRPDTPIEKIKQEGKGLWILPINLIKDYLAGPSEKGNGKAAARRSLRLRIVDRMPILQKISNAVIRSRKSKHSPFLPMTPLRWKSPLGPLTSACESRLAWRFDMPDFVLRMKRKEVMKQLKSASDGFKKRDVNNVWVSFDTPYPYSGETLLEGLTMEETARGVAFEGIERGVFLVFGDDTGSGIGSSTGEATIAPEIVTLPGIDRKVPVFDLSRLFSKTELEEIRAYHPRFQKSAVLLRSSNKITVDAVLGLWHLQGYLRPTLSKR